MWYRARNTPQNPRLLCIVGRQIFSRSSGPETGQKKSASGERLPGRQGPRSHTYLMAVERNGTDPSCESDLKVSAHPSLHPPPSLASRPVRVDKQASLSESPIAVFTNIIPVLEPTHVLVKPVAGQNKSAGHCFLPKAEEKKRSVSGVSPPGHRGARSPKHLMEVSVKNITYPSCESDLNVSASLYLLTNLASRPVRVDKRTSLRRHPVAVSTNMPVPVKVLAGQRSISGERPPGHRGPRISTNLIDMVGRNIAEPLCSDLQAIAPLSIPRLPSLASRPVRGDKRTSLCERPVSVPVSMNMSILKITRVPVKPVAEP